MESKRRTKGGRKFLFTDKSIEALPPHDRSSRSAMTEYSDTKSNGLRLCVGPTGNKYFWHRYTYNGQKRIVRLGKYPTYSLDEARKIVNENRTLLDRELDPTDERNKRKAMPTLSEFAAQDYLPHAQLRKRSVRDDAAKIRGEIGQRLGSMPLDKINKREVMGLHDAIRKKTSPATANRYLFLLSAMFRLAVEMEYVEKNPVKGVKKFKEAEPRRRTLEGEELSRFLQAIAEETNKTAANALRLLLLTGLRSRSELFSLRWSEVDLGKGTARLLHTKNGRERTVVLNSHAVELLRTIREEAAPDCPWVFPAAKGDGHLSDVRKALHRALRRAGISDIRPHDLRRSFGSLAVNAGVDIYQVKDLLGHSTVAVTQKVYAHLLQGTLRNASEAVGQSIEAAMGRAA